jgi:negative regulator of sigma-B (phosphoserine phosphatase)
MSGRLIEWGCAARPLPGEEVCGDRGLVTSGGPGAVAVAVDGLGHGAQAALAAERAVQAVRAAARHDDIREAIENCHRALADTRGAAVSAARFEDGRLDWAGVGNVEGRIVRGAGARGQALLLHPGVVGHELPPLRVAVVPLARGDLVVMATDGVDPAFADGLSPAGSCQTIAAGILDRCARDSDDALVLAVRYLGGAR